MLESMWKKSLSDLQGNYPELIKLYRGVSSVDLSNMEKSFDTKISDIDEDWEKFLQYADGASILDYCLLGVRSVAIVKIEDVNRELWQYNSWTKDKFVSFLGDSTGMNIGFIHEGGVTRGIAYLDEASDTAVLPIASSFQNFITSFIDDIRSTILRWQEKSEEHPPNEITTQELWPWDLKESCTRDPNLKSILKNGSLRDLYIHEPEYVTTVENGIK